MFLKFFLDGVVTLASMLDTAIFFLAQHPEMQEKAFEQIQVSASKIYVK
jgi:hypothetical protein